MLKITVHPKGQVEPVDDEVAMHAIKQVLERQGFVTRYMKDGLWMKDSDDDEVNIEIVPDNGA